MRKFIGYIKCPACGFTHIVDPRQVTIFFNYDLKHQIAEVVCHSCKQVVVSNIDEADVFAFTAMGVKAVPWQSKLPPLTEEDIDGWDFEEEIKRCQLID